MGYFPTGTAIAEFEEKYCARCIHNEDPESIEQYMVKLYDNEGVDKDFFLCPVMLIQSGGWLEALEMDEDAKAFIRAHFIYNDNDGEQKCIMFKEK